MPEAHRRLLCLFGRPPFGRVLRCSDLGGASLLLRTAAFASSMYSKQRVLSCSDNNPDDPRRLRQGGGLCGLLRSRALNVTHGRFAPAADVAGKAGWPEARAG